MKTNKVVAAGLFCLTASLVGLEGISAERRLAVAGSEAIIPFVKSAAQRYVEQTGAAQPVLEGIGSSKGIARLCSRDGAQIIDLATSSRRMTELEWSQCRSRQTNVVEMKIGYDALAVVAGADNPLSNLSIMQLYQAIGSKVPDGKGVQQVNDYQRWNEIDAQLPDASITVLAPSADFGTHGVLMEAVLGSACAQIPSLGGKKESRNYIDRLDYQANCEMFRKDKVFVEMDGLDKIVEQVASSKHSVGVVPFSVYQANRARLNLVGIDAVMPSPASIAGGQYPLAQPLYLYACQYQLRHNPSLGAFIDSLTKPEIWGRNGLWAAQGLIPLSADEQQQVIDIAHSATVVSL